MAANSPQSVGGKARAAKLTANERRDIARRAARARWHKDVPIGERHEGVLVLGNLTLRCSVVDGGTHERMIAANGYVKILVGRTHPLADVNGYAYEHTLVAIAALGRRLTPDEIVHHRNEDKTDNRWENLSVVLRSEHSAHHAATKPRNAIGQLEAAS